MLNMLIVIDQLIVKGSLDRLHAIQKILFGLPIIYLPFARCHLIDVQSDLSAFT